jgi:hypothetical protein
MKSNISKNDNDPTMRAEALILLARVRVIQEEMARLPVLDDRTADEILGHNEHGHFD